MTTRLEQLKEEDTYLINTICLPKKTNEYQKKAESVTAYGFGIIKSPDILPDTLQKVDLTLNSSRCPGDLLCVVYKDPNEPQICEVILVFMTHE